MDNTTESNIYAKIIIDISNEQVDRTFCYKVPKALEGSIDIGSCVQIPFGRGNNIRTGYVMELTDTADFDPSKIKFTLFIFPFSSFSFSAKYNSKLEKSFKFCNFLIE